MKICSLVPAATEVLFALGLGDRVVGVTHECDWPPEAAQRPVVTASLIQTGDLESGEIDSVVAETARDGHPLYAIEEEPWAEIEADIVVMQELCDVCAVSTDQVNGAVSARSLDVEVLDFSPSTLDGIADEIVALQSSCRYVAATPSMRKPDRCATVRAAAIRASNASRDRAAVPVFIAALTDKSDMVRLQAAKALSNIPDPSAAEPLTRVLGNLAETRDVRIAASEALRHYRKVDVGRVLAGTVGGRDFSIAWQSRWSLRILTGRDLGYDERAWLEFLAGPDKPLG